MSQQLIDTYLQVFTNTRGAYSRDFDCHILPETLCFTERVAFTHWYFIINMDLSSYEQYSHHCKRVQCLQKQEGSPKYIAHYL